MAQTVVTFIGYVVVWVVGFLLMAIVLGPFVQALLPPRKLPKGWDDYPIDRSENDKE